jgi:hypothetical protein
MVIDHVFGIVTARNIMAIEDGHCTVPTNEEILAMAGKHYAVKGFDLQGRPDTNPREHRSDTGLRGGGGGGGGGTRPCVRERSSMWAL